MINSANPSGEPGEAHSVASNQTGDVVAEEGPAAPSGRAPLDVLSQELLEFCKARCHILQ